VKLEFFDVPPPICEKNGILIKTASSLVSAWTEKMIVDIAKKSLFGKARERPDLVKRFTDRVKKEGVFENLQAFE
jgi:polar amino acid transport system substrate-binding protein